MKLLLAPRLALALTWGFSIVVIVVLVVSTNMIRRQHHDDGAKAAQGYARLSTEHVTGSLQTIDLTLQIISEHLASRQRWPGNLAGDSKADERKAIVSIMSSYSSRLLGAIGMIVADPDGILVVDKSVLPRHGHIVIALVDGERLVKRLFKRAGRVALVAENPVYPTLEILEGMDLEVWGVVVGKFKRLTS